jgi:hypothetical protein
VLELFDTLGRAFRQSFDPAVIEVLDETDHLMSRRCALSKKPEAYALDVATDEKSSSDPVNHRLRSGKSILAPCQQLNNRDAAGRNVDADRVSHSGFPQDRQRLISRPLIRARD